MAAHGGDFYRHRRGLLTEEGAVRFGDHVGEWVGRSATAAGGGRLRERRSFPPEVIPRWPSWGLLGATLPEKYGWRRINPTAYGLAMQELEPATRGCARS